MFIQRFTSALRFASIIPVPVKATVAPRDMIACMPLVGVLLGALVAGADHLFRHLWPVQTAALLDVVLLAAITGAFHLDGLADTADGLYGGRDRQTALAIMKDSRIGSMGVVALICVLAVKWVALAGVNADRVLAFLVVPAYARSGILVAMHRLSYGRGENGLGFDFFSRPIRLRSFAGIIVPAGLSLLMGWRGLLVSTGFVLLVFLMVFYFRRKLNCVTGDMLGAMIEVTEAGLFLMASIGRGP